MASKNTRAGITKSVRKNAWWSYGVMLCVLACGPVEGTEDDASSVEDSRRRDVRDVVAVDRTVNLDGSDPDVANRTDASDGSRSDAAFDARTDALLDARTDAPTDGNACMADLQNDPRNCGFCGRMCVTGRACVSGQCVEAISVENLTTGTTINYDLPLLRGTVGSGVTAIRVTRGTTGQTFPVVNGRYKALVQLVPGVNDITLTAGTLTRSFRLTYTRPTTSYYVRLVYVIASDGNGRFDAPVGEPNDTSSAVARMQLAGRLMQTFTAEAMNEEGFGRRTFRLGTNASGDPDVLVFRSRLTTAQARAMTGNELWSHFYSELGSLPDRDRTKDVVVMSMTHYDPATRRVSAHTALGGGRLALFGSATLHTYATGLSDLVSSWTNVRRIDPALLYDDSASRGTYWANFATGLGATLHELGHTLSLPHPSNGQGIMSREFDHINRTFMMVEPSSATSTALNPIPVSSETGWDRSAAVRLAYFRWLDGTAQTYAVNTEPTIRLTTSSVVITSSAGIRHVAWHDAEGRVKLHDELLMTAPTTFTKSLATLRTQFPTQTMMNVSTIDDDGNVATLDVRIR